MGRDLGDYSPAVLKRVVYAGTPHPSVAQGSAALIALAGLKVPEQQVERGTERIGRERVEQRDRAVGDYRALPLTEKGRSPMVHPPELAVVERDGGRLQVLARGAAATAAADHPVATDEDEDEGPTERSGHWRED